MKQAQIKMEDKTMKKTFTKKDLKNGDIVVTRGGEPGVVILDKEILGYCQISREYRRGEIHTGSGVCL